MGTGLGIQVEFFESSMEIRDIFYDLKDGKIKFESAVAKADRLLRLMELLAKQFWNKNIEFSWEYLLTNGLLCPHDVKLFKKWIKREMKFKGVKKMWKYKDTNNYNFTN